MATRRRPLGVVLLPALAISCTSFHERQHIVAVGDVGKNYYRITVSGYTFLAASQYAAGWYDAIAVDTLFGELQGARVQVDRTTLLGHPSRQPVQHPPPSHSSNGSTPSTNSSPPVCGPTTVEPPLKSHIASIDGEPLDGKRFVMFLSTNSDFLASQLGALAQSNVIKQSLQGLLTRGDRERSQDAKAHLNADLHRAELLEGRLRSEADAISALNNAQGSDVVTRIVELVRSIALSSNRPQDASSIVDLPSARLWMADSLDAFIPNDGE